jgi:hypothetical protein
MGVYSLWSHYHWSWYHCRLPHRYAVTPQLPSNVLLTLPRSHTVDFPDKNKFLTEKETKMMVDRINIDRGDAEPDKLGWANALKHLGKPPPSFQGRCSELILPLRRFQNLGFRTLLLFLDHARLRLLV